MKNYRNKQQGHAAILFALFIPVLFGVFTLGSDGARAIQDKARLEEAVEVATLAVAGENSDDFSSQKQTVKKYVQYYFPLAEVIDSSIEVNKITCDKNPNCHIDDQPFFEYQVKAKIKQDAWFPGNSAIVGMGENYDVAGRSIARKYQSEAVDVILVSDYSASMNDYWDGGKKRKYLDLQDIISEVSNELEKYNDIAREDKNKLSVIGFDYYTSQYVSGKRKYYDHLICRNDKRCNSSNPGVNSSLIEAQEVVRHIFDDNHFSHQPVQGAVTNISVFHDIELTTDMNSVRKQVNQFRVPKSGGSGTASYAGIIRGAQVAKNGNNSRKLLILLSDGMDSYPQVTDKLISAGLCSTIYNTLNSGESASGKKIKARMVAVGFDYDIRRYPQMKNCVGDNNVYEAQDRVALKNRILELITEEIGHLAP